MARILKIVIVLAAGLGALMVAHAGTSWGGELKSFKCFSVVGADPSHTVRLIDQFQDKSPVAVGPAVLICRPVTVETISGPPAPAFPKAPDHLTCYKLSRASTPRFAVEVTNQFGTFVAGLGLASHLCEPAVKQILP